MSLHKSLQEEMDALRSDEPRQVIIGATTAAGGYALPCTVYLFQQKHPASRIQLVIGNRAATLQRLNDGVLDFAPLEGGPARETEEEPEGWQALDVRKKSWF